MLKQKLIGMSLLASLFMGASASTVSADANTYKKAAIGAAAVTGYGLVKGKGKVATIGGIVTAGTYLKYRSDKKKEAAKEKRRINWYKYRYGRNWRSHYQK